MFKLFLKSFKYCWILQAICTH